MKHSRFIILFAFSCTFFCSQVIAQDIRMVKNFWGTKFYDDDNKLLSPALVLDLMKSNPEAHTEFKKAKSNNAGAQVLGFVGGALIGWPIGTALAGGDPQWGLAAGGAGLLLIAIPLTTSANKHAARAIEIYNSDGSSARGVSVGFIPYGTGAKLVIRF